MCSERVISARSLSVIYASRLIFLMADSLIYLTVRVIDGGRYGNTRDRVRRLLEMIRLRASLNCRAGRILPHHNHKSPLAARKVLQITTIFAMTSLANGSIADRIAARSDGAIDIADWACSGITWRAARVRAFAMASSIERVRDPSASSGAMNAQISDR